MESSNRLSPQPPPRRVAQVSVVDGLRTRGLLTAQQFQAGKQFWQDFTLGLADHGGVGRYSAEAPIPRHHAEGRLIGTEARIAARQRFHAASQSLAPVLREVATRVCCEDMGLEALEAGLKLPRRSGKLALACALDQLVLHYRDGQQAYGTQAPKYSR